MLTVLGELALRNDQRAWTQTLIETFSTLDIEEKAARQAISRLAERGWLESNKIGRRTRWALTPSVTDLLEEGAARIYGFGQQSEDWDGQWLLVTASVPERQRNVRYELTKSLNWAGFGSLGHGWWITTRLDRESEASNALAEAGIADATSFVATSGSLGEPTDVAQRAWDLDAVRTAYDGFLRYVEGLARLVESGERLPVAALVELVHAWRRFPFLDPDLPAELLPADWPGGHAAQRFRELHDLLAPLANSWWQDTQTRFS